MAKYVLNPKLEDMNKLLEDPEQRLNLVVAGTNDAVMMVESEAYELTEEEMLGAVMFGHEQMQPVIDLPSSAWPKQAAKEPFDFQPEDISGCYAKRRERSARPAMRKPPSRSRQAGAPGRHRSAKRAMTILEGAVTRRSKEQEHAVGRTASRSSKRWCCAAT